MLIMGLCVAEDKNPVTENILQIIYYVYFVSHWKWDGTYIKKTKIT